MTPPKKEESIKDPTKASMVSINELEAHLKKVKIDNKQDVIINDQPGGMMHVSSPKDGAALGQISSIQDQTNSNIHEGPFYFGEDKDKIDGE